MFTVWGEGCLNPLIKWPTKAKWKLLLKLSPTEWSCCLKYHSKGSRVIIITTSMVSCSKVPWDSKVNKFCSKKANPEFMGKLFFRENARTNLFIFVFLFFVREIITENFQITWGIQRTFVKLQDRNGHPKQGPVNRTFASEQRLQSS